MTQHVLVPLKQAQSLIAYFLGGISSDVRALLDQLKTAPKAMDIKLVFSGRGDEMSIVVSGSDTREAISGLSYQVWSRWLSITMTPNNLFISTRDCSHVELNRREKKALMAAVHRYLSNEEEST